MVGLTSSTPKAHPPQDASGSLKDRCGIFGGTFDPIHIGHLILAQEALSQLNLHRVLWVLTPYSPHKEPGSISDVQLRLELLKAAIQDNDQFQISFVDINRPPPHFAADTLEILKGELPASKLVYLMGGDSLQDLPAWHEPHRLLKLADELGVMRRPGYRFDLESLEQKLPGIEKKVRWIDAPLLEISSSQIRQKIKHRQAFRYYLHPAVYRLICKWNLYTSTAPSV